MSDYRIDECGMRWNKAGPEDTPDYNDVLDDYEENVSRETLDQRSYLDGLTLSPMGILVLPTDWQDVDTSNSGDLDDSYNERER